MFDQLPTDAAAARSWTWDDIRPYFDALEARPLNAGTLESWLKDWTALSEVLGEVASRARVATTQNTADAEADAYLKFLLDQIIPPVEVAGNRLKNRLLDSGLTPAGMEIPLRNMRAEAELFREENIPLATADQKLGMEYAKITGAQTVEIDGAEKTLTQLTPYFLSEDRPLREKVWTMMMGRWLQDRESVNEVWVKMLPLRHQIAQNAGFGDYRAYTWKAKNRFDYTTEDCYTFHSAIEEVVVPAAQRVLERRKAALGVDSLRPWDLNVDPEGRPALKPFQSDAEFRRKTAAVFHQVHPRAGQYFDIMIEENLLDLENRKNKGPGGYCTRFARVKRPFIFMNAVGVIGDVKTLLHEAGHAFHGFEVVKLPYQQQRGYPTEFAEVASMSMELLSLPYLSGANGEGFFPDEDARRYAVEQFEKIILFWPYMAVVDAFQHWVYTHIAEAQDPMQCDQVWGELWNRFMRGVDWSGYEDAMMTGWHRKQHIFRYPFYYVEYGLAQLGAVQVWANALEDQHKAVEDYFGALMLGTTLSLPNLFAAAGAKFAFDAGTMRRAVDLLEKKIDEMRS